MKKPVLFTMKMKNEKERELWQNYAKNRYGEPLSVVIRRLMEEDMKDQIPRDNVKFEELINILREENYKNYKNLLNRLTIINEYLSSSTYEISIELDVIRGLILNKIDEFHQKFKNATCTSESIMNLKNEISKIFEDTRGKNL